MVEQAVVETTEGQPEAGAEAADAQDNVEALLKEFDDSSPDKTEVNVESEKLSADEVREAVDFYRSQRSQNAIQEVVDLAKPVFEGLGLNVSDKVVRAMMEDSARDNTPFLNAFANRSRNPEAFGKLVRAVAKDAAKELNPTDPNATADVNAMTAAVRASQTPASRADNAEYEQKIRSMSDAEFFAMKKGNNPF